MLVSHGAAMIGLRTEGPVARRAKQYGRMAAMATIVLFALAGLWVAYGLNGYVVTGVQDAAGPSNPLSKVVTLVTGGWMANYGVHPWMIAAPVIGFAGAALAFLGFARMPWLTLLGTTLAIVGIISTAGVSLFPFLLPSSLNPNVSLTVWDASSSHLTLFIMLFVTAIFLPLIVAYTAWVYRVMRGKVSADTISTNPNAY
jgi:cytochrome d ubiquinol oxidase subunit II